MTPATVNFRSFNNEAWQEGWTLTFADASAFDFGDFEPLRMQVKRSEFSTSPVLDLTVGDGLTITVDGGLDLDVPVDDVAALLGSYPYDLIGTVAGEPVVLQVGTVEFAQGKTY